MADKFEALLDAARGRNADVEWELIHHPGLDDAVHVIPKGVLDEDTGDGQTWKEKGWRKGAPSEGGSRRTASAAASSGEGA